MEDWQIRVARERADLAVKLFALSSFISRDDPAFLALEERDKQLLRRQRQAMLEYCEALDERIRRFPAPKSDEG